MLNVWNMIILYLHGKFFITLHLPAYILHCIRAPPKQGRYWEIQSRCPRVEGNLEGREGLTVLKSIFPFWGWENVLYIKIQRLFYCWHSTAESLVIFCLFFGGLLKCQVVVWQINDSSRMRREEEGIMVQYNLRSPSGNKNDPSPPAGRACHQHLSLSGRGDTDSALISRWSNFSKLPPPPPVISSPLDTGSNPINFQKGCWNPVEQLMPIPFMAIEMGKCALGIHKHFFSSILNWCKDVLTINLVQQNAF